MTSLDTVFSHDEMLVRLSDEAECARWMRERYADDSADDSSACESAGLVDVFTTILEYIAEGRDRGQMETRAWVVLYAIRPELLAGESMNDFAKYRGVSRPAINQQLYELRRRVPALVVDTDARKGLSWDKAASGERRSKGQQQRRARERAAFLRSREAA